MKIGIIGSMVNNAYIMAKVLHKNNFDVTFIRDIEDHFIPHQPIWVDNRIQLNSSHLYNTNLNDCLSFDRNQKWVKPSWYYNPMDNDSIETTKLTHLSHISNYFIKYIASWRLYRSFGWIQTFSLLQSVDFIFACGISSSIIAFLSNKPYICWSYGGDIRKLMRLENIRGSFKSRIYDETTIILLKNAYQNALAIGFNYGEKIYCSGGIFKKKQCLSFDNSAVIPFPAFYHQYTNYEPKISQVKDIIKYDKINILIPSRIDFEVKGHDKLLMAIKRLPKSHNMHFIFTGWGVDREQVREDFINYSDVNFTILETMLSRPLLYDLINQSDLIIDQFNIGIYGTATLESMSFGKPVMMYLDADKSGHIDIPPILNCFSEEDIFNALNKINNQEINLKVLGEQCKRWTMKYHGNDVFVDTIKSFFI